MSYNFLENSTTLAILEFLTELSICVSLGCNVSYLIRKSKSKRMHATPLLVIRVALFYLYFLHNYLLTISFTRSSTVRRLAMNLLTEVLQLIMTLEHFIIVSSSAITTHKVNQSTISDVLLGSVFLYRFWSVGGGK